MDSILALISLSKKSGNVVSGEFSTENAIREGKARLVIIAKDASKNTEKKFSDKARYYRVPCVKYGNKAALGSAMGLKERACAAVLNQGLADAIVSKLNHQGELNGENQDI